MASVTRMWTDLLKPLGDVFSKSYDTSGNIINSLKKGIDARLIRPDGSLNKGLIEAVGGKVRPGFKNGRKAEFNYGGYKKGDPINNPETAQIDNWMRAKSLFYNQDGRLQQSRVAGAAVGFGGGAIAGLNLVGDMVFGE